MYSRGSPSAPQPGPSCGQLSCLCCGNSLPNGLRVGGCGTSTSGLPAPPVGRCPGGVVNVPQEALRFGVQGCSSEASLGDREDSPASAREACWLAPWPGRQAIHAPPPTLGSVPGQPWGLAAGKGEGGRRLLKAFWRRRLVWVSWGLYERGSAKAGKALLAKGRASTKQGQGWVRGSRPRPQRGGGPGGGLDHVGSAAPKAHSGPWARRWRSQTQGAPPYPVTALLHSPRRSKPGVPKARARPREAQARGLLG